MSEYIPIPNPVNGLLRLLDAFNQMTFQDYLIVLGAIMGIIMGVVVLWGLFSMIYRAFRPNLSTASNGSFAQQETNEQTVERTDGDDQ